MTKLEQLIEQLCLDGVEYKKLIDSISIQRGTRVVRNQLSSDGQFPVYQNSLTPLGYHTEYNCNKNTTFIIVAGAAGEIGFSTVDFWAADDCFCLVCDDKIIDRYLYHALLNQQASIYSKVRKASIPRLGRSVVESIIIPIPPLEVQVEIVRILDKFTELTTELATELANRKKQYEYYSRQLFTAAKNTQLTTLEQISLNCDSQRKPVTSNKRTSGIYPYYGASGIVDYVDAYIFDGDYLLISEDGANLLARNTPIAFSVSGKTWVNNHAHVLKFDNYHTRRYVEIYLNSIDLSPYISGAAQPKLNQKNLNKIEIPLPPIEEQRRIVDILDRFDKLCNDITEGLPAEIEARQKQYEYYRDKLLSFNCK